GVAMLMGRGAFSLSTLRMTTADVRLNPLAPAVGNAVDVSVRVQNAGAADVKGVRVELFADGTRLGEVSGNIAAGKDFVFSGFPKWTAASGAHKLLLRASAGGRIVEATRDVAVGAAIMLAKPLLTTATLVTPTTQAPPPSTQTPIAGLRTTAVTGMTLMMVANPDLQVGPGDIMFLPISPKAGDPLTISITVRNVGTGAANSATVRAILQADGTEVTRREFPVNLAASGMASLSWPVTTPSGKVLTAVVTAIVANDARADNNQAQATTSVAIALQRQLSPMILQVQPK
ncbi:MAG TPA: CARDB domain-containing protein, partial [Candidatus Eisenbacteria bacterium]|nr:CARDB domain-containing protein [Candidatus Eisenbacteria bacterium]